MDHKELEVFSEECNYGIVRMPGRHFPGCVLQGDSLSILLRCAERAYAIALATKNSDLIDEIESLKESLKDRLQHYEQVLEAHGMDLPYARR
jgi:predicted RNase H-like HicB family nuclease